MLYRVRQNVSHLINHIALHIIQNAQSSRSPLTDSPNHTVHRLSTLTIHRRSTPPNPQIAP